MSTYAKSEAREWAWQTMEGTAGVLIPTFTADLQHVNQAAIRHDVRKDIEYGFWGSLLAAEAATTLPEYISCLEWAIDESRGRLHLIHHASFNTLAENIQAVQAAETAGATLVLLSYPPTFYPDTAQEIYEYTRAFCAQTNLGVILFPVPLWGFERIHPAGFAPELITQIVRDVPNIVAIKAEGGMPALGGFVQTFKAVGDKVLVTTPLEGDGLPLAAILNIPFIGTSNYQYHGSMVPRIHALIRRGSFDEAMKLYWQMHPARLADRAAMATVSGANFAHRMLWKYESWLSGYNGGPLRMPTMRLVPGQMSMLRRGLASSGMAVAPGSDKDFFVGRNPT